MSVRDELAGIIMSPESLDGGPISCGPNSVYAARTADAILAAGYRKPTVIGYVVVNRSGAMLGKQFETREDAQALADAWTADCQTTGTDWDYRVAEVTEAAA
jgi:hypothetical protein